MMATRSGSAPVAPSRLAKAIAQFANASVSGCAGVNSKWIRDGDDKLYVRKWTGRRLELANWSFKRRGTGHARSLLKYLEALLTRSMIPQSELYVENVVNDRFASFFRRRDGWTEEGSPYNPAPSFVFARVSPSSRALPETSLEVARARGAQEEEAEEEEAQDGVRRTLC